MPNDKDAVENLEREQQIYRLPSVASSDCFRKMYDVIDSNTIALEWLETTLAELEYKAEDRTYSIILTILSATLDSCRILADDGYVNTGRVHGLQHSASADYSDYKTNNLLLSGIKIGRVTAKVGDLGLGEQAVVTETCFY